VQPASSLLLNGTATAAATITQTNVLGDAHCELKCHAQRTASMPPQHLTVKLESITPYHVTDLGCTPPLINPILAQAHACIHAAASHQPFSLACRLGQPLGHMLSKSSQVSEDTRCMHPPVTGPGTAGPSDGMRRLQCCRTV
jgi:hypothetical protein